MYVLRSTTDDKYFEVNQKVIDTSILLKNICELTNVSEPIEVNCSARSLNIFIKLIDHYELITDYHDVEFEKELFQNIDDNMLVKIVKELAILDSDFMFDALAELILNRIKDMDRKQMEEYLAVHDDFSSVERELINTYRLEYLISINSDQFGINFPFPGTNFVSLRNKFYLPFNVLLSRVVERSGEKEAFILSTINKTLKNEVDRHPLKLYSFNVDSYGWMINISLPRYSFTLSPNRFDKRYFDRIKNRKIMIENLLDIENGLELICLCYESAILNEALLQCSSLDIIIPQKNNVLRIDFRDKKDHIFYFDIQKCQIPFVIYKLHSLHIDFDTIFQQLIAKGFSKKIKISLMNDCDFFDSGDIHMYKLPNASKFHEVCISNWDDIKWPNFKDFIKKYIEADGVLKSKKQLFKIPNTYHRNMGPHYPHIYPISSLEDFL